MGTRNDLKINFQNGTFKYLSAPLHTPVEALDVASLELNIIFLVGPTGTPATGCAPMCTASTRCYDRV